MNQLINFKKLSFYVKMDFKVGTIDGIFQVQGVPKKMFIKEMGQDRIFLNTPSFSMDKMRRI